MQWKDNILLKNYKECTQPVNKKPYKYEVMDKKNLHKWKCAQSLSHVPLFAIPGTVAHQALLSMGFPRQADWGRLPFPSPRNLPSPETETVSIFHIGRRILYHYRHVGSSSTHTHLPYISILLNCNKSWSPRSSLGENREELTSSSK